MSAVREQADEPSDQGARPPRSHWFAWFTFYFAFLWTLAAVAVWLICRRFEWEWAPVDDTFSARLAQALSEVLLTGLLLLCWAIPIAIIVTCYLVHRVIRSERAKAMRPAPSQA